MKNLLHQLVFLFMAKRYPNIPVISSVKDFFDTYGLGKPLHSDFMCMKLEDQPDNKLVHMPLYRANFFRVIHFTKANLHFNSVGKQHNVINNCICFTYPGKLESWTRSGKIFGFVVYFLPAFAGLDITRQNFDIDFPFFNYNSEPLITLTKADTKEIKHIEDEMIREMISPEPDKMEMLKKLLYIYLQKVKRIYNRKADKQSVELITSKKIFNRFRKELDDYMQQLSAEEKISMPTVSVLAGKMHISANYLNSIIKELTGKTASAHIQEKMMLEAKAFLIHTDLQVKDIAYKMGFENTSYFNRFFKNGSSATPIEFRKRYVKQ